MLDVHSDSVKEAQGMVLQLEQSGPLDRMLVDGTTIATAYMGKIGEGTCGLPEPRPSCCEPVEPSLHHPFLSPPSSQIEIDPPGLVAVAGLSPEPNSESDLDLESNPDSDEELSRWGTETVLINSVADIAEACQFERRAIIKYISVKDFPDIDLHLLTDFLQSCPALTSLDLQNTTFNMEINFDTRNIQFSDEGPSLKHLLMSCMPYAHMGFLIHWLSNLKCPVHLSKNLIVTIIGGDEKDELDAFGFLLEDLSGLWQSAEGLSISFLQHSSSAYGGECYHLDLYKSETGKGSNKSQAFLKVRVSSLGHVLGNFSRLLTDKNFNDVKLITLCVCGILGLTQISELPAETKDHWGAFDHFFMNSNEYEVETTIELVGHGITDVAAYDALAARGRWSNRNSDTAAV
ncbi:hypothetical protein ARMSODRAFT_1022687 [Armillaria solidipes]|uniref:F-box domain-containing protein n=1 Tax=Armillaria solidipes TaxID=1076256 RepID=A0A2H3B278_9AGAR|nr:hypothetical protein ARMSODRAFT_1022687 [Armillaria solidipes]